VPPRAKDRLSSDIRIGPGGDISIPSSHVPGLAEVWTCRLMMTLLAPMISSRLRERSPILVVAARRCLPPVECCLGVRPSHAAKPRALWHDLPKLAQVAAKGVYRLRGLPDQQLAYAEDDRGTLALVTLHGHEAHRRAHRCRRMAASRDAPSHRSSAYAAALQPRSSSPSFFCRLTNGLT
jgi:hypothetical protein